MKTLATLIADAEFSAAMLRCAELFAAYRNRLPIIPYAYSRTRLLRRPAYELIAMRWAPGSVSPIHDHGSSRCWVYMLEGSLDVQNYERDGEFDAQPVALRQTECVALRAGDVDHRLTPRELHRVKNSAPEPAFSLQLYAEPILEYAIVDAHAGTARTVTATCDLEISLAELSG
ncbi:MAG TPA: cysteine dioxygenase family protein [Candidatus Acidoferrales bacterium]|nr:cysteine dioxygenase family protein [Candidatus Acidoferrales bacterium]